MYKSYGTKLPTFIQYVLYIINVLCVIYVLPETFFFIENLLFSRSFVEDLPALQKNRSYIIHEYTSVHTKLLKIKRAATVN